MMNDKMRLFEQRCIELGIEYTDQRYHQTQSLGQIMSDLSEWCTRAAWNGDWCIICIEALRDNALWMAGYAPTIRLVVNELGHWADYEFFEDDLGRKVFEVYLPRLEDSDE